MDDLQFALELLRREWIDPARLAQAWALAQEQRISLQDALIRNGSLSFDQLVQLETEGAPKAPEPPAEIGELASFGPYLLRGRVLEDAAGPVYRASKPGSDRDYLLCILPPHDAIKAEARARVTLEHPNLSKAAAFGAVDGRHFCASRDSAGAEPLRARAPLSSEAAIALARQAADALRAVHAAGFAHGRLSPDALFVTRQGDALLLPPVPGRTDRAADWRELATTLRAAVRRPSREFLVQIEAIRRGGAAPAPVAPRSRRWISVAAAAAVVAAVAAVLLWPVSSLPDSVPPAPAHTEAPSHRLRALLERNAFDEALELAPDQAALIEREAAAALDSLLRQIDAEPEGGRFALERFLARVRGLPAVARRVGAELDRLDAAVESARTAERDERMRRDADAQFAALEATLHAFEMRGRYAQALEILKSMRPAAAGNPHLVRRVDDRIAELGRRLVEFGARTPDPGRPDEIWAEARRHMDAAKLQDAIVALTELAAVEPDRPRAYANRALCLWRLGNPVAAAADAERAVRIGEDATARLVLGWESLRRGEAARAVREFDDAIELGAGADAYEGRAGGRGLLGEFEAALRDLAEAMRLDPARDGAKPVVAMRARLLLRASRIEEAEREARRWTELAPADAEAFATLGEALRLANRRAEAREAFRRAVQLGADAALAERLRELEEAPPSAPKVEAPRPEPKPSSDPVAEARRSFDDARRILAEHESSPSRSSVLEELRSIYFEGALARATGPAQLEALRRWCKERRRRDLERRVEDELSLLGPPPPERDKREEARRERERARRTADEFLARRAQEAKERLEELVRFMARAGYAPPAAVERVREFAARAGIESTGLEGLAHSSDKAAREFETRFARIARAVGDRILEGVDRILAMGEPGAAFDLLQRVLAVDPENPRAHTGLGHVRVDGRWLRRHEAERWAQGLVWHERWGWVLAREQARYGPEAYFDLEHRAWRSVREWDAMRQSPSTAWRMRSEHFEVTSTAPLETTVELLSRLEAFFMQAFRQYDAYFGVKLVFAVAPNRPPHKVHFYRDREQFLQHARPPDAAALGFYDPNARASYFYATEGRVPVMVLQHEITHQILEEYAPSRTPSAAGSMPWWIVEGSAVYLEEAFFRGGLLTVGEVDDHPRLRQYRERLASEPSLPRILALQTSEQWNRGDVLQHYRAAGAAVHFFMNFDGGRYRGDFVEMLRDAYAGNVRSVDHYFGLSQTSLARLMERYYGAK
jgi:tetratricopeptide (TPR) repeat protein